MAKQVKTKVKRAEWKGYHSCNLLTADELGYETWAAAQIITWSDVDVLVQKGYKFSIAYDDYHSGYTVNLYASDAKLDWAGYTLTAWADDVESAVKLLFYKHFVMCAEQWEVAPNNTEKQHRRYG